MSWRTLSEAQFLLEGFNADERTSVESAAGGDEGLTELLATAIAEWRGAVAASGNEVDSTADTVPDTCRVYLVARLRWQLLLKFPELKTFQTEVREKAAQAAEEKLQRVLQGKDPVETPDEESSRPRPSIKTIDGEDPPPRLFTKTTEDGL